MSSKTKMIRKRIKISLITNLLKLRSYEGICVKPTKIMAKSHEFCSHIISFQAAKFHAILPLVFGISITTFHDPHLYWD